MFISRLSFLNPKESWKYLKNEYSLHQLIWGVMSRTGEQKRDFLYRIVNDNPPTVYIQSAYPPASNMDIFEVETKEFFPNFKPGQVLRFNARVNPIIAKAREGKRSSKHDVVMDTKMEYRKKGGKMPSMNEIIHGAMDRWFNERAQRFGVAFKDNTLMFSEYTQRLLLKREREMKISTVDATGILLIRDADAFKDIVEKGVGSAKGFGCGMFLLKPPQ